MIGDISNIPTIELLDDKAASEADLKICEYALAMGVTHHSDGYPVQERWDVNRKIIMRINAELNRREEST